MIPLEPTPAQRRPRYGLRGTLATIAFAVALRGLLWVLSRWLKKRERAE